VGSNTRLCRVAISTSYSAMIYRWSPSLWTNWAWHFVRQRIPTKFPSRKRL
jgi:hypothetical protein